MNMSQDLQTRFQNDVLSIIGHTQDGESISFVQTSLRHKGWKNLGGSISAFETIIEAAGFKLRRTYRKGTHILHITFVTL
jgi:hypothetical protein